MSNFWDFLTPADLINRWKTEEDRLKDEQAAWLQRELDSLDRLDRVCSQCGRGPGAHDDTGKCCPS